MTKKTETTISVNGGPAVPLDVLDAALDKVLAKPKTETRSLMCRLSDDEQRVRGVDLADAEQLLRDLAEEKRDLTARTKGAEISRDKLADTVKHKQEERPVTVLLTPDYSADSMTITRTDTGEIVAIRQLTHSERQPELFGQEA